MQPVQDFLFLANTRKSMSVLPILAGTMPQRSLRYIFVTLVVICLLPSASIEKHISGFDIAALCRGSDVHALIFATLVELFPGDGVVVVRVVVDAFLVFVASVVEKDAAICYAVLGLVVDRAFMVCRRACDVAAFCLMRWSARNHTRSRDTARHCRRNRLPDAQNAGSRPIGYHSECSNDKHHRTQDLRLVS
jgi:hypothetical protein